jgi:dTDP-glucose 4,6-dehydratase
MKTILVTGGCGFIGSNFILNQFRKYAEIRIINIDKLTYAGVEDNLQELNDWQGNKSLSRFIDYKFIKGDICDQELLGEIFTEKIDVVINFAAESHVDRSIADPTPFITTNIIGTQRLLDSCKKAAIPLYIQISTDEVYGSLGDEGEFTETSLISPNSPYSASKAAADMLVMSYFKTYGFPAIVTRCSNNYGPRQYPEKLIPLMISKAINDQKLPVYGNGENVRDWIHVDDHCAGIDAVINNGKAGEVYNFGGEYEIKNIDLVKKLLEILNKPESLIEYVEDRLGHDHRYAVSIEKSVTQLDWEPEVKFEDGINKTIKWYIKTVANEVE